MEVIYEPEEVQDPGSAALRDSYSCSVVCVMFVPRVAVLGSS